MKPSHGYVPRTAQVCQMALWTRLWSSSIQQSLRLYTRRKCSSIHWSGVVTESSALANPHVMQAGHLVRTALAEQQGARKENQGLRFFTAAFTPHFEGKEETS